MTENTKKAKIELMVYFSDSFGSNMRIDYGTGHEMNFAIILMICDKLGFFSEEDYESLVHNVFYGYIDLMRKIQLTYRLEPAGSHGVWGLDDYHFLPFLFGGSELINNPIVKTPDYIHRDDILQNYHEDYMYLGIFLFNL